MAFGDAQVPRERRDVDEGRKALDSVVDMSPPPYSPGPGCFRSACLNLPFDVNRQKCALSASQTGSRIGSLFEISAIDLPIVLLSHSFRNPIAMDCRRSTRPRHERPAVRD